MNGVEVAMDAPRKRQERPVGFVGSLGLLLLLAGAAELPAATFTVNNTADAVDANPGNGVCETAPGNGVCTLRAAIREANALAAGAPHTINVPAGTYTLTIAGRNENAAATGDLDITRSMTISGAGSASTIIQAGTLPANGIDRVLQVLAGVTASISGLTIQNGNSGLQRGGGIDNLGFLILTNVIVTNNTNTTEGGGIQSDGAATSLALTNVTVSNNGSASTTRGGGINVRNSQDVRLTDVTLSGNTALEGGGMRMEGTSGTAELTGVTFSGNTATDGGGLLTRGAGTPTLTNVTLSGNTASGSGGGIRSESTGLTLTNVTLSGNSASAGGGIHRQAGTVTLTNTILANSPSGGNCSGTITNGGNNLADDATCGTIPATLSGLDPTLADNGGPTWTHALLTGSSALDTGTNTGCPATDQRGYGRPANGTCDIGAYEESDYDIVIDGDFSEWDDGVGNEFCLADQCGANDWTSPAPLDLTKTCIASNQYDTFYTLLAVDDVTLSGGGTITSCMLLDTDTPDNGFADFVLCMTLQGPGATTVQSVELFSCDDTAFDGCPGATSIKTYTPPAYAFGNTAPGPFDAADSFVELAVPYSDLGVSGGQVLFSSYITYPGKGFLTTPKDSIFCSSGAQDYASRISYDLDTGSLAATAVELVSFEALPADSAVDLEWRTASELDNLGFHLYRALSESGPWERITESLIPGLGSSPEGARYGYRDAGLVNGVTYFYRLEDIETSGTTEFHGPVSATPQPAVAGDPPSDDPEPDDPSDPGAAWITYGEPAATSLRIVERGPGHVVLELVTGGFWARPDAEGGVWLSVPGFAEGDEPGAPALPRRRTWLEAVAGRQVKLASVRGRDVVAFSGLRPAVTGAPELWEEADGTLRAGQRRTRPGQAFQAAGLYPEEAARLLGVAFQGDVKKAQIELSPLRWDRSGGQLLLARRLEVRVSFAGREKDELALGGSHGRKKRAKKGRLSEGVIARLATQGRGLYAVGFEELFGSGGRGVGVSQLRLSRQGEAVAFHVEPGGKKFGRGSVLYFVSAGASSNPYGPEAVYELSLEDGGVAMPLASASPHGGAVPYYWHRAEQEVDYSYQGSLLTSPERWLWEYVISGQTRSYTFPVSAPAVTGEPSLLEVWLQGASDFPAAPDHHLRVSVNGSVVGEASWNGKYPYRIEAEIWPGVLREGENLLQLENVGDTGAQYSLVLLDRYALSYPRQLVARAGVVEGRFDRWGSAEVQGLGSEAFVVETTHSPERWLTGALSTPRGVSFRAEAGRDYLAVSAGSVLRPEVRPASRSRLSSASNRADYLVLGPRAFLEAAEPLLERRRGQGLEALGVAIEEVYDAFGHGESRPEAVRAFLGHAYHHWQVAPRYVLLLGDATYDFKDHLGTGVVNRVPPYMIKDTYMWTVSDPAYAAVNGEDLLPDLAIGRLPAQSLEQARAAVHKVLAWENAGFDLSGRAVLVADNADRAGDFERDAERVARTLLSGHEVERIYLGQLGAAATRATIRDAFDRGSSLMSYMGHGAILMWASENVLSFGDVAGLSPQAQQPVLLIMNCLNGYFHFPYLNSLSEELVEAEDKGAIAVFSPSSMSVQWAASLYHEALVSELASGRHARLGDAILAAQMAYANTGARPELLGVYQLLGDPALTIR